MSIKVEIPFKVVTRIGRTIISDPNEISLKRVREIVAGKDASFSRALAMALLLESDFPNKHRDFERVLANENEPGEIRHLAALHLGMVNNAAALEILIKHLQIEDEFALAGVIKALGRIGGERALEAVIKLQHGQGMVATQAAFATSLIAYRLGLSEHTLPAPADSDYLEPSHCERPVEVTAADPIESEICLRSLSHQSVAIEFAESPMYQIRCDRNIWMVLLNRDNADPKRWVHLKKRKALAGVIARRNRSNGLYSASFVILSAPAPEGSEIDFLIYRLEGDPAFGGRARLEEGSLGFEVRPLAGLRGFGIQIEGSLRGEGLIFRSAVSTVHGRKSALAEVVDFEPEIPQLLPPYQSESSSSES